MDYEHRFYPFVNNLILSLNIKKTQKFFGIRAANEWVFFGGEKNDGGLDSFLPTSFPRLRVNESGIA